MLMAVVTVALMVRAAHLLAAHASPVFVAHRNWPQTDMHIFGQWAERILDGDVLGRARFHPVLDWMARTAPADAWERWFGDAPTFFKAPLYAYAVALLEWLFGDPALPMAVLQIAASIASTVLLFLITDRLFGAVAGALAALSFAVYGPAVHYDVVMLRGPWIVLITLGVTWRLMLLRERFTPRSAALLGLLVGVGILLNESFTTLPPVILLAFAWWAPGFARWAAGAGAFLVGLAVALAPLVARNLAVGAPPLDVAITGAWVIALSNASDSDPNFFTFAKPSFIPLMEAADGRLGRAALLCLESFDGVGAIVAFYLRRMAGLIVPFENADNASFYYATTISPLLDWLPDWAWLFPLVGVGMVLALRGPWRPLSALVPPFVVLLASNLVAPPLSRYRLPLLVLAFPFAGLALERLMRWLARRRWASLGAALAGAVAFWALAGLAERRIVLAAPESWAWVYRMADFSIAAREYEKEGRYREASREYLALASRSPHGSRQWARALVLAVPLQLKAGDPGGARVTLDAAWQSAPADPRALLAIGDLYRKDFGDPTVATDAYRRAEALQPDGEVLALVRQRLAQVGATPIP